MEIQFESKPQPTQVNMFKFVVFSALVAVALAADIPFEGCEGWPAPLSVNIPECTASPCGFRNGDSFTLNFDINTVADTTNSLPVSASINIGGNIVNYPLPSGDACSVLSSSCPVAQGRYTVSFPVTIDGIPAGDSTVTVEIHDDAGNRVSCGRVTTDFGF